ncbi:hypothetical protein ACHAXT_006964 [Thalassiosira profunda]
MPPKVAKRKKSPIRVVIRCSWSGARLSVPTVEDQPVKGSTTLLQLLLRLESALPPSLLQGDASASSATLVCLRRVVPQSEWETTALKQVLEGDDGSAGVVLTLDLGSTGNAASAPKKSDPVKSAIASAASALNIKPIVASAGAVAPAAAPAAVPAATSAPEPMDISPPEPETTPKMLPEEAWNKVLQSNFDAATKDCLNTLLKIIDNLLSRPDEPKVRSIRCANAAFDKRVGRCAGGYDFLYSVGFQPNYAALGGGNAQPETLELTAENESRELLLRGRKVLVHSAVRDLGIEEGDLPPIPKTPESLPASTLAAPPASATASRNNSRGPASQFNVYKTHSHNIQSAAMGAPDPYSDASGMSTTERQLQQLQSKKDRLERELQSIEADRGLVAYRAGDGSSAVEARSTAAATGSAGKSDSSLVAARMKRMEEERKKREEGGFTTKAMRDLERMKKAKVYSHAQIRVNFSDGTHLHAKFLPREKVAAVRSVIKSAFHPSLAESLDFDLYVAPPRRLLNDAKTLSDEELVPAAKIHVSWKVGASPGGSYLRDELFSGGSNAGASAFPDAKPIVKEKRPPGAPKRKDTGDGGGGQSKEDILMQRMLGKKTGLLGKKSSSNASGSDQGGAKKGGKPKPKWFKG